MTDTRVIMHCAHVSIDICDMDDMIHTSTRWGELI